MQALRPTPRAFAAAPRPVVCVRPQQVTVARAHPMDVSVDWESFKRHEKDTGSSEVQVAKLTARVRHLTTHLQANRKDYASTRGLMAILSQRKALLVFLYAKDKQAFANCVRTLKIRNPIKTVIMN